MNRTSRYIVIALFALGAGTVQLLRQSGTTKIADRPLHVRSAEEHESTSRSGADTNDRASRSSIVEASRARRSNVWVEGSGIVEAVLRDDNEGARHQKFILRVSKDITVLVSHNIDIARRVPLDKGDDVVIRGEYIWNTKGGIVHWTHHDPRGRRDGGWIRLGDNVYE